MSRIFGAEDCSSDEAENFKTNNEYAKKYDSWRKKEELNKLKTKYGEDVLHEEESSSSSDDDDEGVEITENVEKDFFRTLSCLKNKDPSIYEQDTIFFNNQDSGSKIKKEKKEKPVFLKDYERNLILEKGGVLSDEEDESERPISPTYNEEQKKLKESFKKVVQDNNDENEESWGGIFKQRNKTKEEVEEEESDYKQWLAGQKTKLEDKQIEEDLKPLKEYWNKPNLEDGEKFLRDYILKKSYLDKDDDNYIPTYDEIIHDSDQDLSNDEINIEKQEEFEHKFNFRYEEPDQNFIKRYPRTMESSLRKTDDRRKLKRQEIKERKKKEKEEKMREVKKMQEIKLKEIEEKLEKLKEITGNANLEFADADIEGDFDPEEHDKKMQALFNDNFYAMPEDEQKPEFPDLDKELEIENWERYNGDEDTYEPNCEDEDFNMDCDYDPNVPKTSGDNAEGKKKRKKKSKFAVAVSKPKPKFDPNDKKFEKYFEEYYKLDCEDIIGDTTCRFKYRKVVPNDFGLSTEEVLLANERELNKWCSLKKAVQIRSDEVEKYEQIAYQKKGQNINLKTKILPSLFTTAPADKTVQEKNRNESNNGNSSAKTMDDKNITENTFESKSKGMKKKMKQINKNLDINEKKQSPILTENHEINSTKKKKNGGDVATKSSNIPLNTVLEDKMIQIKNRDGSNNGNYSAETTDDQNITENTFEKNDKSKGMKKKTKQVNKNMEIKPINQEKQSPSSESLTTKINSKKKKRNAVDVATKSNNRKNVKTENDETIVPVIESATDKNVSKDTGRAVIKSNKKKNKTVIASSETDRKLNNNKNLKVNSTIKKRKRKNNDVQPNKNKKQKISHDRSKNVSMTDARLAAYGINPKKFKNKLKYKK